MYRYCTLCGAARLIPANENEKCSGPGGRDDISSGVTLLSSTATCSRTTGGGPPLGRERDGSITTMPARLAKAGFRSFNFHAEGKPAPSVSIGGNPSAVLYGTTPTSLFWSWRKLVN